MRSLLEVRGDVGGWPHLPTTPGSLKGALCPNHYKEFLDLCKRQPKN